MVVFELAKVDLQVQIHRVGAVLVNEDRDLVIVGRVYFEEAVIIVLLDLRELVQLAEEPKIEIRSYIGRRRIAIIEDVHQILVGQEGTSAFEFEQFPGRFVDERRTMVAVLHAAAVCGRALRTSDAILLHVTHISANADRR